MVSKENFLLKEIPNLHPRSSQYKDFWKAEKRKCIEGYWVSGRYMPGNIYFYVNFWHILKNKDNYSKVKVIALPDLRDIEWIKGYMFMEARGFSGFVEDNEITCCRDVKKIEVGLDNKTLEPDDYLAALKYLPKECFTLTNTLKKYEEARTYLPKNHGVNKGKPLYQNEALDVIDLECFSPETKVLMGDLSRKEIKDIVIGDIVMGSKGQTDVIDTMQGVNTMYEIITQSGDKQIVSQGHAVQLRHTIFVNGKYVNKKRQKGHYKTTVTALPVEKLYEERLKPSFRARYHLYRSEMLEFKETVQPIDPYIFGLWLSDGKSADPVIEITDLEPLKFISETYTCEIKTSIKREKRKQSYRIYFKKRKELRELGVLNNKHIPDVYTLGSIEQRLQFLAGVIDGDGWQQKGCFIVGEPKKHIAEKYVDICRSLGLTSYLAIHTMKSGAYLYYVHIGGDIHLIPTKLKRKQATEIVRRNNYSNRSFTIKKLKLGTFCGITVSAPDSLFLLEDFTVAHNCRRVGKSYFAAGGIIAPNFLFDGATDYDDYLEAIKIGNPMSSETLVGAIDSKYSNDLLRKFMLGLSHIKGAYKVGTTNFPSPLAKKTSGTLSPNDSIVSRYMDSDGDWRGSQSKLHHRSFRDNPFAGNGTGPSITCLEEIGFMENVREAKGALKDVTSNGTQKFGSIFMFGTGGAMAQGATQAAQEIFLNPEEYDCIAFPDFYENSGKKIGFFIPYHLGLNQFKDKEGVTDVVEAKKWVEKKRVRLRAGKSKKPYNDELQNNPEVPSEIFLLTNSNIFPVADLSDHLKSLEASLSGFTSGQLGKLVLSPANVRGIKWEPDLKNELKVCDYPMGKQDDSTGAVQIWEHPPIEDIPYGMYIAGTDPYDQDKSESSSSLGSTFIYKVGDFRQGGIRDMIVAEYTARPDTASDHHEIVRRLLLYYNATDLYENERNSMKMHFEHKNSLYLLANTPTILKATEGSKVDRHYGTHMTAAIKSELEIYARDWLLEPAGNGLLNLHKIYSKSLLKELIAYNNLGNFDRVIAFLLTICLKLQNFRVLIEDKKKEIAQDSFFNRQLFK